MVKKIEDIRRLAESKKLTVMTDDYKTVRTLMKFKCQVCNHTFEDMYYRLRIKKICCPYCRKSSPKNVHQRTKLATVKEEILAEGYTCLSDQYYSNKKTLSLVCNEGHYCKISWNNWKFKHRCPICNSKNRLDSRREATAVYLEQNGYTLLGLEGDTIRGSLLTIKCPNGHVTKRKWIYLYYLKRFCTKCKINQPEQEISKFLEEVGVTNIEHRNRTLLKNKEIDIFLPNQKLGIEYNGLYWHCDLIIPNPSIHLEKQTLCENENIRLITFWQDEWRDKKEVCKNILLAALGQVKIPEKYTIENISEEKSKEFFANNSLESIPSTRSSNIGIVCQEQVYAVLSYLIQGGILNIVCFSSKIPNSLSKLIEHLLLLEKPKYIYAKVNKRYETVTDYLNAGFVEKETCLGFKWTDLYKTYSAYFEGKKLYKIYDNGQTVLAKTIDQG